MTTSKAASARREVLKRIEAAQNELYAACVLASPLRGWVEQWQSIGDHADATKALWHAIADAPHPESHDSEPRARQ